MRLTELPHHENCECVVCRPLQIETEYTTHNRKGEWRYVLRSVECWNVERNYWRVWFDRYLNGELRDTQRQDIDTWIRSTTQHNQIAEGE